MRTTWMIVLAFVVLPACSLLEPTPPPPPAPKRPALAVGMSKQQVIRIKGHPDSRIGEAGLECFQYTSPATAPLGSGALSVYFDSAGRVITFDARACSAEALRRYAGVE
ncbi:hypothetical protein [Cupriavidus malaysiensis]|nr:hypothetical protein [Cupriavidus malaysiensis]